MLAAHDLSVQVGSRAILRRISFALQPQRWLMVAGPNGAGKSTLVHAISQGVSYSGSITFEGRDVRRLSSRALARSMGVLTQNHHVGYSFTVEEIVRLGRYAHAQGMFSAASGDDEEHIESALACTGMSALRRQSVLTLSGGELQRAFLAQVFAQDPKLLLLDEPTNHLDLVYQQQVFELIGQWMRRTGGAVLSVVHDLSLARAYGTDAMLLHEGQIVALGDVRSVFSRDNLQAVYGMDVHQWMRTMLAQWEEIGVEN